MKWNWLAFGCGLIFGACGMATVIGCLGLGVKRLREENLRWWKENCHLYYAPRAKDIPRVFVAYFQRDPGSQHKEGA